MAGSSAVCNIAFEREGREKKEVITTQGILGTNLLNFYVTVIVHDYFVLVLRIS